MNIALLQTEVQEFIHRYEGSTIDLAFAGSPFSDISVQELIQQIESRNKVVHKLPTWYHRIGIYYPAKLNLEQTSSEITALYKANLLGSGSLADITGGFGVDSFYFSKISSSVAYFEVNTELAMIAMHNFQILDVENVNCKAENGVSGIDSKKYDSIYVDPSRRHNSKGKVYFLSDCEPDIPKNIDYLLARCDNLMIKTSPMLDISQGLIELSNVSEVHIVAVGNEVKELIWILNKTANSFPIIKAVNIEKDTVSKFEFKWNQKANARYELPNQFLFEPNAAMMKAGAFDLIAERYSIGKLHKNTHLYTHSNFIDFPGRIFKIEAIIPYTKNEIKKAITFSKANIAIRNFPESVAVLRKKWSIKDGGDNYLFFTTLLSDQKVMLTCRKIQ